MNQKKESQSSPSSNSKNQNQTPHEKLHQLKNNNHKIKGNTASEMNRKFYTQIRKRG